MIEFEDGEQTIFKSPIGYRNKAILTNKRLIFTKEKSWFKKESFITEQISLSDIAMVDTDTSGFTSLTQNAYI